MYLFIAIVKGAALSNNPFKHIINYFPCVKDSLHLHLCSEFH